MLHQLQLSVNKAGGELEGSVRQLQPNEEEEAERGRGVEVAGNTCVHKKHWVLLFFGGFLGNCHACADNKLQLATQTTVTR